MLLGQKDKGQEASSFKPASRHKKSGFSLVEILVVMAIFLVLIGAIIMALNTGQYSNSISIAKVDLQSSVRNLMNWITKDVRQSITWDMANNSPSTIYIKFRQVQGWNAATHTLTLNDDFIEYAYDSSAQTITRRLLDSSGNELQRWEFSDITEEPFYTRDSSGTIVDMSGSDLLISNRIIIVIASSAQVRGSLNIPFSLTEEVKIRNE